MNRFKLSITALLLFMIHSQWTTPINAQDYTGATSIIEDQFKYNPIVGDDVTTIEGIVGKLLPPLLTIAGLVLFGMIIWGGFDILTSASDTKKADAGKARVTTAIMGFMIVFAAYWIVQIIQIILGFTILE